MIRRLSSRVAIATLFAVVSAVSPTGCTTARKVTAKNFAPTAKITQLPLVLDVDTGRDDAWTIMAALDRFEVCAIISTYGNAPCELTTGNSLNVLKLSQENLPNISATEKSLPLWSGEKTPTSPAPETALVEIARRARVNGNGLCNLFLPASSQNPQNKDENWVKSFKDFLVKNGPIDYVVCGPAINLKNLATEFGYDDQGQPRIRKYIKSVTVMGGSFDHNLPVDFNFKADPAAAQDIISIFGESLTLVPFDETKKLLMTEDEIIKLRPMNKAASFAKDLMLAHARGWSSDRKIMLHDPATLLALEDASSSVKVEYDEVLIVQSGDNAGKAIHAAGGTKVRVLSIESGSEQDVRNRILKTYLGLEL